MTLSGYADAFTTMLKNIKTQNGKATIVVLQCADMQQEISTLKKNPKTSQETKKRN